jgi:hypothetical protein
MQRFDGRLRMVGFLSRLSKGFRHICLVLAEMPENIGIIRFVHYIPQNDTYSRLAPPGCTPSTPAASLQTAARPE